MSAPISVTHISTACALLHIGPVTFLTDPVFDPIHSTYPIPRSKEVLRKTHDPALNLDQLPPVDAILLSHEDHDDNLDPSGRTLLNGRHVFTTPDGAKNLAPRPAVKAMKPWETLDAKIAGVDFKITGTPCIHTPEGEVTGFIVESAELLGTDAASGKPNAIWFSGDTVYMEEHAKMKEKWYIKVAILNLGDASPPPPYGPAQITIGGKEAVQVVNDIGAEMVVPIHFEGWEHFTQGKDGLLVEFAKGGIEDKVKWLTPGVERRIL